NGHLADDLQRLFRSLFPNRALRLRELKMSVDSTSPMEPKMNHARFLIQLHHDLVDQHTDDLLLNHHRTGGIVPYLGKVAAEISDLLLIGRAQGLFRSVQGRDLPLNLLASLHFAVPS